MGDWKLVVPLGTTNMVLNPSAETTLNWGSNCGTGVTVTRSTTYSFRGLYSYKVVQVGANANTGMYVTASRLSNADHYLNFRVRGTFATLAALFYSAAPANLGSVTPALLYTDGDWKQYGVAVPAATANTAVTVYIIQTTAAAAEFYVDCVQVEALSGWTTYCDGDQPGCKWNGTRHGSTSYRLDSREGGAVRDLQSYYGIHIKSVSGYGGPTKESMLEPLAFVDGSVYQGTRASGRILQLTLDYEGTSLTNAFSRRKAFMRDINRNKVWPQQPCLWWYTGAGKTVQLSAFVESGDEGAGMDGFHEVLPLNLMAVEDPYWEELAEETGVIAASASLSSFGAASLQTQVTSDDQWDATTGAWGALGITALGGNNSIYAFAKDSAGNLYVGGDFLNLNGIAEADYIAKRDVDGTWSALSTGTGGIVQALACDAADNLYVGGSFTNLTDGSGDGISMWNGAAFVSLGSGATGGDQTIGTICIARDGTVYVGGGGQNIGGEATADYIAKWSGGAWSALHATAPNGVVLAITESSDGTIYVGGAFTSVGGVSASHIAAYNPESEVWSAVGAGCDNLVYSLAVGPDGRIYASGTFTTAGAVAAFRIAVWNGAGWNALGAGCNNLVYRIAITSDGTVYACGVFTTAGGITVPGFAAWNGTSWSAPSIVLPTGAIVFALYADGDTLYLGHDKEATGDGVSTVAGTASLSVGADVTSTGWVTNSGTAISYPVIAITSDVAATVKSIRNETTKQVLQFNDEPLAANGWITIDCRKGKEAVYAGYTGGPSRIIALKQPSDLGSFCLLPGGNKLSVLCYGDGATVTCSLRWRVRHEGMDGGAV